MSKRALALFVLFSAACSSTTPAPASLADFPNLNNDRVLQDIRRMSADEFEGRQPGSNGEKLTTAYLIDQLKSAGLEPGNPDGSWTQKVSLVGLTPKPQGAFVVKKGAVTKQFNINQDVVVMSKHVTEDVKLENSELVFAGYGVQAPEYQWDDFKGMDVKGKTIVVLVNDPPVADGTGDGKTLDSRVFGGNAMTYYGRWTYKFEKAAELGAAGALIVHET